LRRPKNKIEAAFGSYGWSGEAPKMIHGIIWVCGLFSIKRACKKIREMEDSNQMVEIFGDRLRVTTIADLCKEAAERIGC